MPTNGLRDSGPIFLAKVEEDNEAQRGERNMLVHREYKAEFTLNSGLAHCPDQTKSRKFHKRKMTHFE